MSVIIPVYNGAAHLRTAVESVLQQTYGQWEMLIVDDGSEDESHPLAQSLVGREPDRIRVLQHEGGGNRGVAASRNLAVAAARGAYLAFLDADDRWRPEKLSRQVRYMEAHPDVGVSWTRAVIVREGAGRDFIPGVDVLGNEPPADLKEATESILQVSTNYIFSSIMVRAEAFREIEGFPEDLPYQSEDRLMVARVASRYRAARVDEVLCEYLAHDASYSAGVVKRHIAPVIFYDMQARFVIWLSNEGQRTDWARDMTLTLLPVFFLPALFCRLDLRMIAGVVARTCSVLALNPALSMRFGWHVLHRTRMVRLIRERKLPKTDAPKTPAS